MIFAWSVIYPTKGKHSQEWEHLLSTLRSFRYQPALNITIVTNVNETQQRGL